MECVKECQYTVVSVWNVLECQYTVVFVWNVLECQYTVVSVWNAFRSVNILDLACGMCSGV